MSEWNLGWNISPSLEVGDLVEFTEEIKKEIYFPDGIFRISEIDLAPTNWITCHPITIWLSPTGMLENPDPRLCIREGKLIVNCSRKGTSISGDFKTEIVIFKKI